MAGRVPTGCTDLGNDPRGVAHTVMARLVRAINSSTCAATGGPDKPGHDGWGTSLPVGQISDFTVVSEMCASGRACPGHLRFNGGGRMAGTRPAMTVRQWTRRQILLYPAPYPDSYGPSPAMMHKGTAGPSQPARGVLFDPHRRKAGSGLIDVSPCLAIG